MLEKFKDSGKSSTQDLLKSILDSAFYGLMAFKSVRNEKNEITDFECLFANDVTENITGKKVEELEGASIKNVIPGNDIVDYFNRFKKVVNTGRLLTFEQYYEYKNQNKWFKISASKLHDGFTITFHDITDIKESIKEVENRELKYQKLFDESIDPIFLIDEEYNFIKTNSSLQELFGYDSDDLKCMKLEELFEDKNQFNLFQKILLDNDKTIEFEATLIDNKNNKKSCLINCVSFFDEIENETTYQGVIRDITKRKQADQELILAEKLSMTGKIARTIAHEIRNPLTNLSLALQQLKEEVPNVEEDAELYFTIIQRNADRIGNLITDLLNSSKSRELKLEKQSLNSVVKQSIKLVSDRLKLQQIKLKEEYEPGHPEILLDSEQMKVALLNLLINAIEAMQPEKGELFVKTYSENDLIKLVVRDNGRGIPKENLENLFEPFFTAKKDGTGLGLTAVQNIIHSHKGRIEAESTPGQGTTFYISFNVNS